MSANESQSTPRLFVSDAVPAEERRSQQVLHELTDEVRSWFPTAEHLAQQLFADSQRLATHYPPSLPIAEIQATIEQQLQVTTQPIASRTRTLRWSGAIAAAAMLLIAVGFTLTQWQANGTTPMTAQQTPTPTVTETPDTVLPVEFQRLSGAEQEAFLDMLESQQLPEMQFSI
jgi:hypothetical protein